MNKYYFEVIDLDMVPELYIMIDDKNERTVNQKQIKRMVDLGIKSVDGLIFTSDKYQKGNESMSNEMNTKVKIEETREEKKINIYQKLIEVRKKVLYVQKSAKGHNFKYASGSSIIAEIRKEMDAQNLLLIPNMEKFETISIGTKLGCQATISYTWIDADDPSSQIKTSSTYIDDKIGGCQGVGAILTYAERYFLCKFFQIATDTEDPDAFNKKHNLINFEDVSTEVSDVESHDFTINDLVNKVCEELFMPFSEEIKNYLLICTKNEKSLKNWFEKFREPTQKQRFVEFYDKFIEKNRFINIKAL